MQFQPEAKESRAVFCEQLMAMAEKDERIVLLEADLMAANGTMPFKQRFPDRTFDVGVAEANMVGVAAGLASCGKIPFTNTFGAFATRRCFDQITISVAYAGLNVKLCGNDPGVASELNGGTHMALEDLTLMRVLPNITIVETVDNVQLAQALPVIAAHQGPCYLRMFRKTTPKVFDQSYRFQLGKADVLREGSDLVIFATGYMLHKALMAAAELATSGIQATVVNIHTLRPLDVECIVAMAKRCGTVVTVENNSRIGALGSAVCETLAEHLPTPVVRVGVKDRFGEVGFIDYLSKALGLDVPDIIAAAKQAVDLKRNKK